MHGATLFWTLNSLPSPRTTLMFLQTRCAYQRAQLVVRQTDAPGTVRTDLGIQLRVKVEVQGSAHINTEEPTFALPPPLLNAAQI